MPQSVSTALTLGNIAVHEIDGLYSLNDLHRASGGEKRHAPNEWTRTQQAQELAQEVSRPGFPGLVVRNGGKAPGTYACRELVIAFAAWISAAFHLKVIRVFLAASQAEAALDPERVKLAHALASHAMAQVAQTVFDAVMAGESEWWRHSRYLLALTYDRGENKPSVPWAKALSVDDMVVSMEELPERLTGPDSFSATDVQLANLARACAEKLGQRAQRAAATKPAQGATFAKALNAPSGWKDERKAAELMQTMRVKTTRPAAYTAEEAEDMHLRGIIGPRQIAKLRRLMV